MEPVNNQNEDKTDLKADFKKEMEKLQQDQIMDPKFRRKKLILWFIRTVLAVILFVWFWETSWVRWILWIYVPLNLLGLFAILGGGYFLKKKVEKVNQKIDGLDS